MKAAIAIAVVFLAGTNAYAVPQSPLAKGRIEAILPTIQAIYSCGIIAMRIETGDDGFVRVYADTDDSYPFPKLKCAQAWVAKNAAKFKLQTGY